MPRPCIHAGKTPNPKTCRVCWWCEQQTEEGDIYRQEWGEQEPKKTKRVSFKPRVALGKKQGV